MTQNVVAPHMKTFARRLRATATPHEQKLWALLRGRRFAGYRFRRQQPIGRYIVDFVCYGRRLVVELDGSQHAESTADIARDAELRRHGFKVLRIWNNALTQDEDAVLEAIWAALRERTGQEVDD